MKRVLMLLPLVVACSHTEEVHVVKQSNDTTSAQKKVVEPAGQPLKPVADVAVSSPLQASLQAPSRWSKGDNAKVALELNNQGTQAVNFTLRSGMAADFILSTNGQPVWRYSDQMMFTQALRPVAIEGGEQREFSVTIPARDLATLAAGEYQLSATFNVLESGAMPAVKPLTIELH